MYIRKFISYLILFLLLPTLAQATPPEQPLEDIPKEEYEETAKEWSELVLIWYTQEKYTKAIILTKKVILLYEKLDKTKEYIINLTTLANLYRDTKDYQEALPLYQKALSKAQLEKYPLMEGYVLGEMGLCYQILLQWDLALDCHRRASDIYRKENYKLYLAEQSYQTASIYHQQEKYNQALPYYREAKKGFEKYDDIESAIHCQQSIAQIYQTEGNLDLALKNYQICLRYYADEGNEIGQYYILTFIAILYNQREEYKKAENTFEGTLIVAKESEKRELIAQAYYNLGCYFAEQKQTEKALENLTEGLEIQPQLKLDAKKEEAFEYLYSNPTFKKLISE